jgi:hypothetical protein
VKSAKLYTLVFFSAHLSLFEQKMQESAEKEPVLPQGENIVHCPAASGEDTTDVSIFNIVAN